jgi:hypothetical protein
MLDELLIETVSVETQAGNPTPLLKEIQARLNAVLKEIQVELQGLNVAELRALDDTYVADYAGRVLSAVTALVFIRLALAQPS